MERLSKRDLELDDEDMLSRGQRIHGSTIKGYTVDAPVTTKLTPLKKGG